MNWSVFLTRSLSAVVYVALMLLGLLYPDPMAILLLALGIQFLCIKEFFRLLEQIEPDLIIPSFWNGLIQMIALGFTLAVGFWNLLNPALWILWLLVPIFCFLWPALRMKQGWKVAQGSLAALFYVVPAMGALILMRGMHYALPLALVVFIWINDTMAYVVGSFIGKHPLSSISPKKTWEGTLGGAVLTLLVAAIWAWISPFEQQISGYVWLLLSFIAAFFGNLGDLFESKLKRMAGVKDSGGLMPGHGGALDRFDSLLMAFPPAAVLLYLLF